MKSPVRTVVILLVATTGALLPSCSNDGNVVGKLPADTLVVHDTLRLHDTTAIHHYDTLRYYDTAWIAAGRSGTIYCGIIYDLRQVVGSTGDTIDTVYAGLTVFSNPAREDLSVALNAVTVPFNGDERNYLLTNALGNVPYGRLFPSLNTLALMGGALYEGFVPRDTAYGWTAVKPVYPQDTGGIVTYDTARARISVPQPVDAPFTFRLRDTTYQAAFDTTSGTYYHLVPDDSSLELSWTAAADYYVLSIAKLQFGYYGGVYLIGEAIDTVVVGTAFTIPAGFMSIDTAGPDSQYYDIVEVDIVGVNGPAPQAGWDTLPAFQSQGMLMALCSDYGFDFLFPDVFAGRFAKRQVRVPHAVSLGRSSLGMLQSAMEGLRSR